ncbi:MAG TPA: hypothetical protein DCL13_00010, partial [Peptococcaceae bacterium]|nr:hypothetical protein [Peptococcaceae bacterium]
MESTFVARVEQMSQYRFLILLFVFLVLFPSAPASADIPSVWVTREIHSFPDGEAVTAGPRVVTVNGHVYMALATCKDYQENRIYVLHSSDGFSWSPVHTYPTVSKVSGLDLAITSAGFHVVWDDEKCDVHHLFVSPDGQQKGPTLLTDSGGQPVLLQKGERITVYYLKKVRFAYYPLVISRSWTPEQPTWTEEAEVLTAGGSYQYTSPSAALSTGGQVYLSAVYYVFNQDYKVHVANLTEEALSSIAASCLVPATATLATGSQVQVFWAEQNDVEGRLYCWCGGEKAAVAPGILKVNRLRARAFDGAVHLLWCDIGQVTEAIKYTCGEGSDFAEPVAVAFAGQMAGLDLALASGSPMIFWAADRAARLSYPVTAASVAAFTYSGQELPGVGRYFYYPGAEQNNRLCLKVTPERPLPNGLYADLGAIPGGARIDGTTDDDGCTYVIEGSLPDAPADVYPISIREATTNTELARFEALINVRPDLVGYGGETTDWTSIEDFTRADIVLHRKGVVRIAFTGADLTGAGVNEIVYLGDYLDPAGTGILAVDAEALPTFRDVPAQVTFYGLPYTSVPDILIDGRPAGDLITDITYTPPGEGGEGVLSFNTARLGTLAAVPRVEVQTP